jgi:group II intron reverse transcriptase/maturase
MLPDLERITQRAAAEPHQRFTALAHHLSEDFLAETWHRLNRRGAPGVDHQTPAAYAADFQEHLSDLVARNRRRAYRAPAVRRVYIPKPGKPDQRRPLGIPTVEDRLLQAAVARLLSAIYEADFRPVSYGFRPGRNAHQALAALRNTVMTGRAHWVVEADIRRYFDHIDHAWLLRMLELRVGDPWILRLVRKWLAAGIFEEGVVTPSIGGAPQGGPLSPLLANVYLHYVLDLWFERVVTPRCQGRATLIRFADDFLALFEDERDARRFLRALPQRMRKFALTLAEEKTRLIPFGRRHWRAHQPYPPHFDFLGFRHHLGHDRHGRMAVVRLPSPKSRQQFLREVKQWLRVHQHDRPRAQARVLHAKLRGFYQYFGLPHTTAALGRVGYAVQWYWYRALCRRSQKGRLRWDVLQRRPWFVLPRPRVVHPMV